VILGDRLADDVSVDLSASDSGHCSCQCNHGNVSVDGEVRMFRISARGISNEPKGMKLHATMHREQFRIRKEAFALRAAT
jgi:hypothetical protein